MNDIIVEALGLSFMASGRQILENVGLTVSRGERLSIVGPNGAGKTTLLKCLAGISRPSGGSVKIDGKPIARYDRRRLARQIGYVPQADSGLCPFSVFEFVMMGRYCHLGTFDRPGEKDRQAVSEAISLTSTEHLAARPVSALSGGERRRVGIAAILAQGAEIFLLDEPTTFLDPRQESDVLRLLGKLNSERGVTMITVTHDVNLAVFSSDRILAIKDGRPVFSGRSESFMDNGILKRVYEKDFSLATHSITGKAFIQPEALQ